MPTKGELVNDLAHLLMSNDLACSHLKWPYRSLFVNMESCPPIYSMGKMRLWWRYGTIPFQREIKHSLPASISEKEWEYMGIYLSNDQSICLWFRGLKGMFPARMAIYLIYSFCIYVHIMESENSEVKMSFLLWCNSGLLLTWTKHFPSFLLHPWPLQVLFDKQMSDKPLITEPCSVWRLECHQLLSKLLASPTNLDTEKP